MYGYVYKTTNLINNKIYIGQHKSSSFDSSYYGSGRVFIRALKKYGKNNFNCELLEWCNNYDELNIKEEYWIHFYNSTDPIIGYNIQIGGNSAPKAEQTKEKLRQARLGKYTGNKNPFYGKKHSIESLIKISNASKGRKTFEGRHHSDETKKKLSKIRKGHFPTNSRKCKCVNDNKVFHSYNEAGRYYKISPCSISNSIREKRKLRNGLVFIEWEEGKIDEKNAKDI